MKAVDFHAHLRPGARAAFLAELDALEIERAVVVPGGSLSPEALARGIADGGERDIAIDNAALMAQAADSEGRLIPFWFGNPHRSPRDYLECASARGLKLGPAVHGIPLGDGRNLAWIEAARARGHVVYLHCLGRLGFDVPDLVLLAQRYSDVRFVLGHAGVGNADFRAVTLIGPCANVAFETSGGFSAVARFAVEKLGAERVLFGSEYPLQDAAVELLKIKRLGLGAAEQARVLRENALALLAPATTSTLPSMEEGFHA